MRAFRLTIVSFAAAALLASGASAQVPGSSTTTGDIYIPGVTFQADNPNYLHRAPFNFEGRVDWNLLKITTPSTMWEFVQRGIHNQDDLEDSAAAIADYQTALSMNSLANGTCQILTTAPTLSPNVNPAPCMFTPRLRLAHLLMDGQPDAAIGLYREVLLIDALRLGVHALVAEALETKAKKAVDAPSKSSFLQQAVAEYQAELDLCPVTPETTRLTGDKANNAHVHWSLAQIYAELGDDPGQAKELQAYLDASQWHSDTYPLRIVLAKARLAKLGN